MSPSDLGRQRNDAHSQVDDKLVLSKNPIDAVRRADSTLDARRVATFVTAESLCSARPVCRLFPTCCSSSSWPSRTGPPTGHGHDPPAHRPDGPENREWGDTRSRGARGNLGHQVARGPLANVRKERGLEPAPDRKKRTTWRECLAAHGDVLAAADCFTVAVWTPRGLTRFTVLVLIHLASRRGQIAGISAEPDGPWVTQLMRNAPDAEDGCLRHIRFLIHDRDPLFQPAGRDTLPPADVTPIRRPARAPNLNAYTERFVRTIKDSCLKRMVLIGEGSRRRAVREFVAHDHHERHHQGLDHRRILPLSTAPPPRGRVPCRQRLGGMLHDDSRSAA